MAPSRDSLASKHHLAARGVTPAAFGRRCIPADCVAPPSHMDDMLGRRALSAGRLAALGATPELHHGLLDVPYVPQSEALCGGAAVAMVYRYWGDAHAGAAEFAPLVDRRAGGIVEGVLAEAVRRRGWTVAVFEGSINQLQTSLSAGRPIIVLLR